MQFAVIVISTNSVAIDINAATGKYTGAIGCSGIASEAAAGNSRLAIRLNKEAATVLDSLVVLDGAARHGKDAVRIIVGSAHSDACAIARSIA